MTILDLEIRNWREESRASLFWQASVGVSLAYIKSRPTIFLIQRGGVYDKVVSNLEEIKARGGPVIAIATEGDAEIGNRADDIVYIPEVPEYLQPLVAVVPLQLLAYYIALMRGCDVDKPRNLANSVTVE